MMSVPDFQVDDIYFSVPDIEELVWEDLHHEGEENDVEAAVACAIYSTLDYVAQHLHERGDQKTADLITFLTYGHMDEADDDD